MRADHLVAGEELRLRHQAAAARQAARARRHLRVRPAHRRHRRRHPAAASRRSPTWRPPARPSSTSTGQRRPSGTTTPCCSRWPTPSATSRSRWRRSGSSSTGAWPTCAAPATRRSRTCTTTAAAWQARSAGCRSASSAPSHDPDEAARLADSLGVALQLTNILRDIREDHQNGRVYLPAEDLAKFDVDLRTDERPAGRPASSFPGWWSSRPNGPATGTPPAGGCCRMLDRRSAACTGAMAGIYRRLLERIAAQPAAVLDSRVSLVQAGESRGRGARPGGEGPMSPRSR